MPFGWIRPSVTQMFKWSSLKKYEHDLLFMIKETFLLLMLGYTKSMCQNVPMLNGLA